jgi:RNA polymerase sigma-54 factor
MNWNSPRLQLKVQQKQVLTPSLMQMVSLLQLNRLELRDMIEQEMMENPVLEEIADDGLPTEQEAGQDNTEVTEAEVPIENDPFEEYDIKAVFEEYMDGAARHREREDYEQPSYERFVAEPTTLTDHLEWQLGVTGASEDCRKAAQSIIGNLNEDGYLTASLEEVATSGEHEPADVEAALALVHQFDPPGVAARDLCECLLLQLAVLAPDNNLARQIVCDHLKHLQNKQYRDLARVLGRPLPAVMSALEVIKSLDPRPGLRYNQAAARLIEPDVYYVKVGDIYQVRINEDDLPQLRLSPLYRRLLEHRKAEADVRSYVRERFNAAMQLIRNISQRKQTILRVSEVIVERQRGFLDHGPDSMMPLMIKEVAEIVGVHPSTVSRAVANKYAHTPQGVLELRSFFSEAVSGAAGQNLSLLTLKRRVKKIIEQEDPAHPLTDEKIAKRLADEGVKVTRRTVAKYREDMKIPSTHQRRVKM